MARRRRDQHGQRAVAGAGARERDRLARGPPLFLLSERQVEQRLRAVVPSASQWKRGVAGESRPFAGVNVLLLGDFYQLPPPSGGYLADVPSSRRPPRLSAAADAEPDLLADYGRNLLWGGALQGVTELEERERCKDDWWNEVVDELRRGELLEENWRYLHGKPVEGCRLTAAERESRRRVIAGPGDPRLGEEKFRWAAAIVANNDAKYQINKDRAEDYSRAAESPLRWSVALDAPSAEVLQTQARGGAGEKVQGARGASLRAQECDKAARVRWLQYHDRDTENLSGMLPLAVGMRVVLADHLDRAEDKLLLRGSAGRIHSWVWKENDLRPTCVYVKFDGAAWQLDGAPEPGLYPVYPARKVWKLDAKRKKPVLKIARTQLPLAPAYAITAHGSQGKTLPAALVDFNVDKRTDVTFGTVAASRVRSREDVLILGSGAPAETTAGGGGGLGSLQGGEGALCGLREMQRCEDAGLLLRPAVGASPSQPLGHFLPRLRPKQGRPEDAEAEAAVWSGALGLLRV